MTSIAITLSAEPFRPDALLEGFGADPACGAIASFTGQVRASDGLTALELEHYPGVTEKALRRIAETAAARWDLTQALIRHRVGRMAVGEPIVLVAAAAPHRRAALEAVSYMIDVLKTQAPFWKKEHTDGEARWVETSTADDAAAAAWLAQGKEAQGKEKA